MEKDEGVPIYLKELSARFGGDICLNFKVNCTARQCSPLRRKFMEFSINNPALSLLMKYLVIGQSLITPNFSAFHWSPCGSLVSITESDQGGPNHQLLQLQRGIILQKETISLRTIYKITKWHKTEKNVVGVTVYSNQSLGRLSFVSSSVKLSQAVSKL